MFRLLALVLFLALAPLANAAGPDFNRSDDLRDPQVLASLARLREDPALSRLATIEHLDERHGVPSFVRLQAAAAPAAGTTREAAARAQLARLAPLYGLEPDDAESAPARYIHDTGRGVIIVAFTQRIDGVPVFRDEMKVLMDRSLRPVAVSGFIPSAQTQVLGTFRLPATAAVERAIADFGGAALLTPGREPVTRQVLFHLGATLVPAWYVEIMGTTQAYAYVYSAENGELLFRDSLMDFDTFGYRVWADGSPAHVPLDNPHGGLTPGPLTYPGLYHPTYVAPPLISLQNTPFSQNDPWLPSGATQTTGNNVDVYTDLYPPDGFTAGDFRATTTSPGVFDYPVTPWLPPTLTQLNGSMTQIFYTVNFLHDWFYDSGFDEISGNAQQDNYGRGGVGGDRLIVEVADFDLINNASMSASSEGTSPRLQISFFTPGTLGLTILETGAVRLAGPAAFGPQTFQISGSLVRPAGNGCPTIGGSITGKIALLERQSGCDPVAQVQAAQTAGAIGAVLIDGTPSAFWPSYLPGSGPSITIPVVTVTRSFGDSLELQLLAGPRSVMLDRPNDPLRDGALDNQVTSHEWGHYMSGRLVGGLSTTMAGGLNEGWSDFVALLTTVRAEDGSQPLNANFGGLYSEGGYVFSGTYTNSYYFGVRRVPYSTDLSKDPLTFGHIADGALLPSGPPILPNGSFNSEVHNTGEVWCTMLWECYAALLRDTGRLTFAQAQLRMRDYLVASQKLTPADPTFTEARDALLAVAAANDAADYVLFWQAFAKRGAGMGAVSPPRTSTSNSPVVESFAASGDLEFVSIALDDDFASCDHDGYLDEGEMGTLTVTLRNTGVINLSATTGSVSSSHPAISFPNGTALSFSPSAPLGLATATARVRLSGSSSMGTAGFTVSFGDPGQVTPQPQNASESFLVHADLLISSTDTFEPETLAWTLGGVSASPWQRLELTPTSHVLFGPDPGTLSDQWAVSPDLHVAPTGTFSFTFTHKFSFERALGTRYDGGLIEISSNGGSTWQDVNQFGAAPGYNGTITNTTGNPLGGRSAFTGTNTGYPATVVSSVNLGTNFAGQTVKVRFRIGTDATGSAPGWQIDNVAFSNLTSPPFVSVVNDPDPCAATAVGDEDPVALAFTIDGAMPARGPVAIRFALPAAGEVDVAVFDVTGRRLETLVSGRQEAGWHSATWAAQRGPGSGVYFARMTAGGRSLVRKIVTLR